MGTNYYVRLPECIQPCEHCAKTGLLHIGKSSAGWKFMHRAYREYRPSGLNFYLNDRISWLRLLDLGPIFDEYGSEIGKKDFLAKIEGKQDGIPHNNDDLRAREAGYLGYRNDFSSDGYDFCDREFS
jgi:hypothetical protein